MRIIAAPADALYDYGNSVPYQGIIDVLTEFIDAYDGIVIVYSRNKDKLERIPDKFKCIPVQGKKIADGTLARAIVEYGKAQGIAEHHDVFVLGVKDPDMYMVNNGGNLFLFGAGYAVKNEAESGKLRRYSSIMINSPEALKEVLDMLQVIQSPWFFKYNLSDITIQISLIKAHTMYQPDDIIQVNDAFNAYLKEGEQVNKDILTSYFLLCCYNKNVIEFFKEADYFGTYPTSDGRVNSDLSHLKNKLRHTFGKRESPELLVRHTPTRKQHKTSKEERLKAWADNQLETIKVDDWYKGKLKGKNIVIIDDYSTNGVTAATAKALLEREEINSLLFVSIGKFNETTNLYEYEVKGDVYSNFEFKRIQKKEGVVGEVNRNSHNEKIQSLYNVLK